MLTFPNIPALDIKAAEAARARQSQLTKPPGSLGQLEALSIQLAAVTGRLDPDLSRKAIIVMAGDHGIAREGVSAYPAEVTPQMVMNFLNGGAAINVLARQAGARVTVVDVGVAVPFDQRTIGALYPCRKPDHGRRRRATRKSALAADPGRRIGTPCPPNQY